MKRDMDLVREILLEMEKSETGRVGKIEIEARSEHEIAHHMHLMKEAGLVKGPTITTMSSAGPEAMATSITWEGHEFLAASRDPGVWQQAMTKAKSIGGTLSIPVLVQLLTTIAKQKLGLP